MFGMSGGMRDARQNRWAAGEKVAVMKVVVVRSPKLVSGLLRLLFGIRKDG